MCCVLGGIAEELTCSLEVPQRDAAAEAALRTAATFGDLTLVQRHRAAAGVDFWVFAPRNSTQTFYAAVWDTL